MMISESPKKSTCFGDLHYQPTCLVGRASGLPRPFLERTGAITEWEQGEGDTLSLAYNEFLTRWTGERGSAWSRETGPEDGEWGLGSNE